VPHSVEKVTTSASGADSSLQPMTKLEEHSWRCSIGICHGDWSIELQDLAGSFFSAPIVGHIGDGNFRLFILLDPKNPKEVVEAEWLVHRALSLEGTFLIAEHGEAISVMRAIKAIDPDNIMNLGKIPPDLRLHGLMLNPPQRRAD
jgi:FAD/FMN-containing dehydrogenase